MVKLPCDRARDRIEIVVLRATNGYREYTTGYKRLGASECTD